MKICTVVGARPQFIKAAVLSRAIKKDSRFSEVLIHTGQHYDPEMSDIFYEELSMPSPQYNLGIAGGTHGENTGRMIAEIEKALLAEDPDWLVLYGDTNSTLAGAVAASKLNNVKIAHIEAGLRSHNRKMPEEINRILADHSSDVLFAPTEVAVQNLKNEGFTSNKIVNVGDIMFESVLYYADNNTTSSDVLEKHNITSRSYVLATVHRQENTDCDDRLKSIFSALGSSQQSILMPLHPRTKKIIIERGIEVSDNIKIVDPVGYLDMLVLQRNAKLIATDSGGMQKEAYFNSVPCITLREETEWTELVDLGVNHLVGVDKGLIVKHLQKDYSHVDWTDLGAPYGDGTTSKQVLNALVNI